MALSLEERKQRKVLRTLVRLKYSLQADEQIEELMQAREALETEGVTPRLETTLADILGTEA